MSSPISELFTERLIRLFIICFLSFSLLSCSDDKTEIDDKKPAVSADASSVLAQPVPEVRESFQVGNNVYVRSLASDDENRFLWVGTSVGALKINLENGELLETFTREEGLANEYIFAIDIDRYDYKWFGTNAGGVSRYKDGVWKTFFPMHGLADYWVYSFAEQKNGTFWIGTWAGVNEVNLDTMQFKTYVKELINEWVYAIDVDSSDRVWFGTEGGISMFDGKRWQHWTHEDGMGAANKANLPISINTGLGTRNRHELSVITEGKESYNPNYVFALHVAPDDSIWVGTWGGGVAHFDGKVWTNFTVEDGLAGNIIYSIEQTEQGVLWFGTNRGLSRYDGKNWQSFNVHDGLLGNDVYAIQATANGDIWVGTKNGVTRMGLQDD